MANKKSYDPNKILALLNKLTPIPFGLYVLFSFIFLIVNLFATVDMLDQLLRTFTGIIVAVYVMVYDKRYISLAIQEENYSEIMMDCLIYGGLACVLNFAGILLLFKGFFVVYFVSDRLDDARGAKNREDTKRDVLGDALFSLNYSSATLGFLIILLVFNGYGLSLFIVSSENEISPSTNSPLIDILYSGILLAIAVIAIFVEYSKRLQEEIYIEKFKRAEDTIYQNDATKALWRGIFACFFGGAGIFIILEAIFYYYVSYLDFPVRTQTESSSKTEDSDLSSPQMHEKRIGEKKKKAKNESQSPSSSDILTEKDLRRLFKEETGKHAVWRGHVTKQYLDWKEGKISEWKEEKLGEFRSHKSSTNTKTCPSCGEEVEFKYKYCKFCGSELEKE